MTKLSPEQEERLAEVAEAKRTTDIDIAVRKLEFEASVEADKGPLYVAVAQAVWAGVPARRIGEAIGSSDHKTIKSYYPLAEGMTFHNVTGGK